MQTYSFATKPTLATKNSRISALALVSLACLVAFGGFANSMVSVQNISIAENSISTISQSVTYLADGAIVNFIHSSDGLGIPTGVGQFYFGELILAAVLIPVVIYIASSTFPGAISAASNANETGWSSTNKTLWNNVFPLMAVVSAILLPIAWIILPFSGAVSGRGGGMI